LKKCSFLRGASFLAVPGLVVTACGELPTNGAPPLPAELRAASQPRDGFRGSSSAGPDPEFVCYRSETANAPQGQYRYRRFRLEFPQSARNGNNTTATLRVRWVDGRNEVRAAANCRIPATPEAVRTMHARLMLDDPRRSDFGPRFDDGCVSGGTCQLDGLVVTTTGPGEPGAYYYAGDWGGWGSSVGDSAGYGGEWDPGVPDDAACDPSRDPTCEQPLTTRDNETLQSVVSKYRRADDKFTDPKKRDMCNDMANTFLQMLSQGLVFRGAYDTQAGDPGAPPHMGAYNPASNHIHFDPQYLDNAEGGDPYWERDLANDALHEAAHAMGYDHGDSMNSPWGPIYADEPFDLLSPGDNSCLNWN
jgi:hypothetical protein